MKRYSGWPALGLVAERQILFDSVHVRWSDEGGLSQGPAAFGIFALQQMPSAGASSRDFAGAGNLEPFAHRLPGLNSFGSSHKIEFADLTCKTRL